MSQSPSSTLGKYQIIREIARSNDIVYEAYDPLMNRRVAVKELSMPGGSTQQQRDDRVKRFLREARAAGSLVHQNIVTVYEVGEEGGRYFIAMEYLDGQNLRNLIDTNGFVEPKKAIDVCLQVLDALEFAHSKGVIHRDVKPDNVQILSNGTVKLTDFGIARLTFEPNITIDGQVFGTPSYMSPEQVNGKEIDARSDLFGVGVILYEAVSGTKPFQGDSVVSVSYAIMNHTPTRPAQADPALWEVMRRAMEKAPQLRFGSAKEMASALRDALMGPSVVPLAPPPTYPQGGAVNPGPPPVIVPGMSPAPAFGQTYTPQPMYPPQAYGQPYGQSAPGPHLPVYYPPPPRPPLVPPEARSFMGRLMLAILLMGGLAALVWFAVAVLSEAAKSGQPEQRRLPVPVSRGEQAPPASRTAPRAAPAASVGYPLDEVRQASGIEERQIALSRASSVWSQALSTGNATPGEATAAFVLLADEMAAQGDLVTASAALYHADGFAGADPVLTDMVALARRSLEN
jgi:eukaryotic-like serine/threonine-protein kinase